VQVRAHGGRLPASVLLDPDRLTVTLDEPAAGVAPGQAVVLYAGSRVVASATITATAA
jgi:tRNA-specific 2-thiouridylase